MIDIGCVPNVTIDVECAEIFSFEKNGEQIQVTPDYLWEMLKFMQGIETNL